MDDLESLVAKRGLGRLEKRLRLRGRVEAPGLDDEAAPWLVLTSEGLWVIGAKSASEGTFWGPAPRVPVRFETVKRQLVLHFGELSFEISTRHATDVRELLGLARVRADRGTAYAPMEPSPCIIPPTAVERAAIASWLHRDEPLLGFLPSARTEAVVSWMPPESPARWSIVVTPERVAAFRVSDVGDVTTTDLAPNRVHLAPDDERLFIGEVALDVSHHPAHARRIATIVSLAPGPRILECALAAWLKGRDRGEWGLTRSLLAAAARRREPLADALSLMVSVELGEPASSHPDLEEEALERAVTIRGALREAWSRWHLGPHTGLTLVKKLPNSRVTLDLHEAIRDRLAAELPPVDAALSDIELAEHALAAEEPDLARRVLEERLGHLRVRPLEQLEPRSAEIAARVAARARVLELLVVARGEPTVPDAETLAELARMEPLSPARLVELVRVAGPDLSPRAAEALATLEARPLTRPTEDAPRALRALTDEELSRLRGSAPQDLVSRLGALQRVVALPDAPARHAVADFCEAVSADEATPVGRTLRATATLLGLGNGVECYVSRGRLSTGVRAFDGTPPFVLIGGRHLDVTDPLYLPERALRFAMASELAHVRFDHGRVTADQVWEGALSRSRQGLEFFFAVLPAFQGLRAAGSVGRVAARLDQRSVQRAIDGAERLNDALRQAMRAARRDSDRGEGLATVNERLIEAHRYLQLNADRAGLVAAGNLAAAVFAMIAVRSRYVDDLASDGNASLLEALRRRVEADAAFADLALRVAGAIAFYLSDDFMVLRRAAQS